MKNDKFGLLCCRSLDDGCTMAGATDLYLRVCRRRLVGVVTKQTRWRWVESRWGLSLTETLSRAWERIHRTRNCCLIWFVIRKSLCRRLHLSWQSICRHSNSNFSFHCLLVLDDLLIWQFALRGANQRLVSRKLLHWQKWLKSIIYISAYLFGHNFIVLPPKPKDTWF